MKIVGYISMYGIKHPIVQGNDLSLSYKQTACGKLLHKPMTPTSKKPTCRMCEIAIDLLRKEGALQEDSN